MTAGTDLRQATLRGAAWTFSMRWGIKLIGLVSTMILARLLPPTDFGIIAMAMLVVTFMDLWTSFNLGIALIQKQGVDRSYYDTTWTMRLIETSALALILFIGAPYAADYFHEPRVTDVLKLLAGSIFLSGFTNIGTIDFRKKLLFHKEFQITMFAKLISFTVTISLALWLRNYWALAIGIAAAYLAGIPLSYLMHPFRPRFSLSRFKELFSFSQWLMVRNIALFLSAKADQLFLGRVTTTHTLGLYNTAAGLAELPSNELGYPIARVLLPVLSTIQDQPERLRKGFLLAINGVNSITLPAAVGLALLAHLAIPILLGDQWLEAIPFLQVLAIFGALHVSYAAVGPLLLAIGKPKLTAYLTWIEAGVLVSLSLYLYPNYGINGIIIAKLATAGLMAILFFTMVTRNTIITPLDIFKSLARPVAATAFMAASIMAMPTALTGNNLIDLASYSLIGGIVYASVLFALWVMFGRADGAEALLLSKILRKKD